MYLGRYCRTFIMLLSCVNVHYVSIPISPLIRPWTSMLDHVFTSPVTCLSILFTRSRDMSVVD